MPEPSRRNGQRPSAFIAPASGFQLPTLWGMAGMLLLLFATAVGYRVLHPGLLTPLPPPKEHADPRQTGDMGGLTMLMRKLQENPGDAPTLLALTTHFLRQENWAPAERFARRAAAAAPGDMQPLYLLGMALHGLGQDEEAAASLERALRIRDEPDLRYSLGILYAHRLNNKQKAAGHLRRGADNPAASGRMKARMEEELARLGQENEGM